MVVLCIVIIESVLCLASGTEYHFNHNDSFSSYYHHHHIYCHDTASVQSFISC